MSSLSVSQKASVLQKANRVAFGGVTSSSNTSEPVPTGVGAECNPDAGILQRVGAALLLQCNPQANICCQNMPPF